jgi:transposase-like protein
MKDSELNLATLAKVFSDENAAREFLESKRWPNGPICPHCECTEVYKLTAKKESKSPVRPGVYKCKKCRKQFTVRIGTVMEESLIPIRKWLMAIHLMTSCKKGISARQMAREVGITKTSAWFMNHRIREAMREGPVLKLFEGIVEVDETYIGGKPRKGDSKRKRGRGTTKQPVLVLVERDGRARAKPIENTTAKTLKNEIAVHVAKEAVVMTDELHSYWGLDKTFARHETVKHGAGEYSRKTQDGLNVHTNTGESFFALLKRGHYGIFHQLSKKHLHRYCNEFTFRWGHRKVSDGERMVAAIRGAEGKRLMYG